MLGKWGQIYRPRIQEGKEGFWQPLLLAEGGGVQVFEFDQLPQVLLYH
jgi:hypothetical protein